MNFSMSALMKLRVSAALLGSLFFAQLVSAEDRTPTPQQSPQPSLNFYGLPGGIDTPSATPLPDGQIAVGVSTFEGGQHVPRLHFKRHRAFLPVFATLAFKILTQVVLRHIATEALMLDI